MVEDLEIVVDKHLIAISKVVTITGDFSNLHIY